MNLNQSLTVDDVDPVAAEFDLDLRVLLAVELFELMMKGVFHVASIGSFGDSLASFLRFQVLTQDRSGFW